MKCLYYPGISEDRNEATSVVILLPKMRNQVLSHHPAQRILQFHRLDKQIVLWIKLGGAHRRFEVETQPFLNAAHPGTFSQIQEQNQVEHNGRGQDGVAAEKVYLDLHLIPKPAEDVNAVPAFLVVPARRIIIDAHLVMNLPVKGGIQLRL